MSAQLFHPVQAVTVSRLDEAEIHLKNRYFLLIEQWAGWLCSPPPLNIFLQCFKVTHISCIVLLAALNWWSEDVAHLKWILWLHEHTMTTAWCCYPCPCSSLNSVLCHSSESESFYLQSFFCLTTRLPHSIYSLLNLIDRTSYLWWVSGQRGLGNGTEMSIHGDHMKVISFFMFIFTNLSWLPVNYMSFFKIILNKRSWLSVIDLRSL